MISYSRLLVTLLAPIGDTLFATAAIRALRQAYPQGHIAALVFPTNREILVGNPDLDEIVVFPTAKTWPGTASFFRLAGMLRRRRFEITLDMGTMTRSLTRVLLGIPRRLSFRFPFLWYLLPNRSDYWLHTHAIYHYLDILQPLGIRVENPQLHMYVGDDDRRFADSYLSSHAASGRGPLIAIHPGGEGYQGMKKWPPAGFAKVGDELVSRYGATVVMLGGPGDRETSDAVIATMSQSAINATGETTLKQTAAIVERSHLFIGNDSSPLHIATAMKVPVVGIYGPSSVDNFYPFGVDHEIVRKPANCSPCFHFVGAAPVWMHSLCRSCHLLQQITPADVLSAVDKLLKRNRELRELR